MIRPWPKYEPYKQYKQPKLYKITITPKWVSTAIGAPFHILAHNKEDAKETTLDWILEMEVFGSNVDYNVKATTEKISKAGIEKIIEKGSYKKKMVLDAIGVID